MSAATEVMQTVTVGTATFRAWRVKLWAIAREPWSEQTWRRVLAAQELHYALGKSAGAALDAAMDAWRMGDQDWNTLPVSAVQHHRGVLSDNEHYAGKAVDLAPIGVYGADHAHLYGGDHGGDPAELVARVITMTGIEAG